MAYTKYSLTPANNTAAPPDGAPEGMLPSAVNDTMRDMMAQIRDVGDGIRDGTYTMTAAVITGGTITGSTINNSAIGGTTAAAGAFTTLSATGVTTVQAGTVSLPAITTTGDTNTGIYFPAADTIAFTEGGVESMRIDSSGNVGIGTSSPSVKLEVSGRVLGDSLVAGNAVYIWSQNRMSLGASYGIESQQNSPLFMLTQGVAQPIVFGTNGTERMRITSGGDLLVGKTANTFSVAGTALYANGEVNIVRDNSIPLYINRLTSDGQLIRFVQDNTEEGNISVSGSTVSYNGGHLSRYAQTTTAKDESLVKGTVLSNLDEMNQYVDKDGNPVANEQLNKVKVSDVEGDVNIAGVFVNWYFDEQHKVDEINMAMTGDMIIRIADGVVVQKGDLLMSAGDGTAKPQGDDIVRSKTIAKVTSNHVTCTYADGSYCVPCVLMAC